MQRKESTFECYDWHYARTEAQELLKLQDIQVHYRLLLLGRDSATRLSETLQVSEGKFSSLVVYSMRKILSLSFPLSRTLQLCLSREVQVVIPPWLRADKWSRPTRLKSLWRNEIIKIKHKKQRGEDTPLAAVLSKTARVQHLLA